MRYFFHLWQDGELRLDLEGSEFETVEHLQDEALAAARELLAERIKEGVPLDVRTSFEVQNEAGETVHSLLFAKVLVEVLTVVDKPKGTLLPIQA